MDKGIRRRSRNSRFTFNIKFYGISFSKFQALERHAIVDGNIRNVRVFILISQHMVIHSGQTLKRERKEQAKEKGAAPDAAEPAPVAPHPCTLHLRRSLTFSYVKNTGCFRVLRSRKPYFGRLPSAGAAAAAAATAAAAAPRGRPRLPEEPAAAEAAAAPLRAERPPRLPLQERRTSSSSSSSSLSSSDEQPGWPGQPSRTFYGGGRRRMTERRGWRGGEVTDKEATKRGQGVWSFMRGCGVL